MKNISKVLFFCLILVSVQTYSQISVTTGMTAQQYVEEVLLSGGVTVSNISFTGSSAAIGYFETGSIPTNLGLSSGLILSTGRVDGSPDIGSSSTVHASSNNNQSGYPLLTSLVGSTTRDAAVLEFDFVPLSDTILFRYIFASEEYPEYVCSNYNDVFAFFISGINPSGGNYNDYNIALIPNTTLPVAINTVNPGVPGSQGSYGGCTSLNYSQYYIDNNNGQSIVFDGFTTVLTAWAKVVPCQNYRIKIAIADVGDYNFDSAVFLEANSFGTSAFHADVDYKLPNNDNYAVEGCTGANAVLTFTIPKPLDEDFTLNYTIEGTAENCVDYVVLPDSTCLETSITIPTGQTTAQIEIYAIDDGIVEGTETINLIFTNSCGESDMITINIVDYSLPLASAFGGASFCESAIVPTQIGVNVSGGVAPYTYLWSEGAGTQKNPIITPAETTNYHVVVTDYCNYSTTSDVLITVYPDPIVYAVAEPQSVCAGSSSTLTAFGADTYMWIGFSNNENPIVVKPNQTASYIVVGTNSDTGCFSNDTITVEVSPIPQVFFEGMPLSDCVPITVDFKETSPDLNIVSWLWMFGDGGSSTAQNPTYTFNQVGTFDVSLLLENEFGCENLLKVNDYVVTWPQPIADFYTDPALGNTQDSTITFEFLSNTDAKNWYWNFGFGDDAISNLPPPIKYSYPGIDSTYFVTLIVSNDYGCADTIIKEIKVFNDELKFYNVITPNGDGINDVLIITNADKYSDNKLVVFNRWGNKVFEQTNYNNDWDGTNVPDGVYYYIFYYRDKYYYSSLTIMR